MTTTVLKRNSKRMKVVDDLRSEDDDADIDQVIDHQDGRQQQVDVAQQPEDRLVRGVPAFADAVYVAVGEGKECRLGARHERRDAQQQHRRHAQYDQVGREAVEDDA